MVISNEEIIEIVESKNLLEEPDCKNIGFKKNFLKRVGFEWLFENNRCHIKVEGASPETVFYHVKGAYFCALNEEGLL